MGGTNVHIFMTCLLFASLFAVINARDGIEVEDEHKFTYAEDEETGPKQWGRLNPDWKTCETGKLQSPIDLHPRKAELRSGLVGNLKIAYNPAPAVLKNRGHDIMVQWTGDAGDLVINGTEYKLIQGHWHTPSEHQIEGRSFDMEMHLVHNSSDGKVAVVAIMYTLGCPDTFLERMLQRLESHHEEVELSVVNPLEIKFGIQKYYRYIGSLTTPPCTEGVIWTVLSKVKTVSKDQLKAMRNGVNDGFEKNARPTQQWDGRSVFLYNHPSEL